MIAHYLLLLLLTKRPIVAPTLDDTIGPSDYTKAIPALPDLYVTWPGKEEGNPRTPVFWID